MADADLTREERRDKVRGRPVYTRGPVIQSLFIAYAITFLSMIALAAWQWQDLREQCIVARENRDALRAAIIEGLPPLGAAYDPVQQIVIPNRATTFQYYIDHPEERERALAQALRQLDRFGRVDC